VDKRVSRRKDLRIPNMRIMTARSKALTIVEPIDAPVNTKAVKFEKAPRSAVHLISSDNLDELIDLLHNEAVI
jgi:electron transfer flavoprotein beta subunit